MSDISSVQFSCSVVPNTLWPHGLQHVRFPCPLPTPRAWSNSYPSSRWRHPTISSSVVPFSSCLQSFPASGSFPMSRFFTSDGQSIGVSASASVLPMNIQNWFLLGWTSWISLLTLEGLSRVFSNTTVQKHHFTFTSLQNELVDTKCLKEWLALMIASISNRLPEAAEEVIRLFHRILWARKAVLRHPGLFWIQI